MPCRSACSTSHSAGVSTSAYGRRPRRLVTRGNVPAHTRNYPPPNRPRRPRYVCARAACDCPGGFVLQPPRGARSRWCPHWLRYPAGITSTAYATIGRVGREDGKVLELGLGDEQTVERVAMVVRQRGDAGHVIERDGKQLDRRRGRYSDGGRGNGSLPSAYLMAISQQLARETIRSFDGSWSISTARGESFPGSIFIQIHSCVSRSSLMAAGHEAGPDGHPPPSRPGDLPASRR